MRVYVNPNAPQDLKDVFAETFPDVERVNPKIIEQLVGGFTDDGPPRVRLRGRPSR
jgi:hypothetical protein